MKKSFYLLLPALFLTAILLVSFSGNDNSDYPNGAPAGYTGSPGDGQNCVACHNGSASTVAGWITSNIPASGYVAGTTYTMTVTVSGSGAKGFEVSPQNVTGTLLGTLTPGSGNKLTGSGKYVTHTSASSSNPKVWTFQWTAPVFGTGEVTFYGAFTLNKPVTKLSTLVVQENTALPLSVTATATPNTLFLGDSTQLGALASGGSGTYLYTWTSVPAGFTSTLQNPVAKPQVNTTYTVSCTDLANTVSSSVTVTVQPHVGISPADGNLLTVSPNPATDHLRISLASEMETTVRLIDMHGRQHYNAAFQPVNGKIETVIDLTTFTQGIYLVNIVSGINFKTVKLVIR